METAVDNTNKLNGDKSSRKPRQGAQMYILPVHRRAAGDDGECSPRSPRRPRTPNTPGKQESYFEGHADTSNSARRGRGKFRAPGNVEPNGDTATNSDSQDHVPKGRDFDATSLRTYADQGKSKSKKGGRGGGRGGSGSGRRGGANGDGQGRGRTSGEDEGLDEDEYNEDSEFTDSSLPSTPVGGGFPRSISGRAAAVGGERELISFDEPAAQDQSALEKLTEAIRSMRTQSAGGSPVDTPPRRPSSPKEEWEELLNMDEGEILRGGRQGSTVADDEAPSPTTSKSFSKIKKRRPSTIEFSMTTVVAEPPSDEPTVVLDCHDFPASFKTHHLHDIFREPRLSSVLSTDALNGTISVRFLAKKAYLDNVANPLAKIKPYNGPMNVIKRSSSPPPPRRPTTTDMVAKRLVHGALGVKVAKSHEQKIAEQQILQAARGK
ncbi:hypothetical protein BC936DRAFT_141526 [Jimgerdemannia flammicorona]|uniref:Uncharacterized protein n=1 Tax=Jimgerdemannia flammicorona TaxID=994334 RepID=A0A433DFZ8_9FUNG|nr:hypothetical protein BC936DRAFT_141526 [Jimgerdemannia flammicorona]